MVFVIVPAYNEAKRIAAVVSKLQAQDVVDRVVVVDDGSSDTTAAEAKSAAAVVLRHKLNRGQGAALETGHAYARQNNATFVVHFDGDGQFDVTEIAPALHALKQKNADILLGSRFLGAKTNMPWVKRALFVPFGKLINWFSGGVQLTDAHNGFRILSKKAFHTLYIRQDRMAHATEIPAQIKALRLSYMEYPVSVEYHEFGQGVRSGFRVLSDLFLGTFIK